VVRTKDGEVLVKVLHRQTARVVELHSLNADHAPRSIEVKDIEGLGRIVWASQ
jgi:phage repressor protein C with HTH and peptisase S24 domain